jgi:hypothetical protein
MGGDIELVQLSLKVPPWEPMRVLSRDELRRTHLPPVTKTAAGPTITQELGSVANERVWMLETRSGRRCCRAAIRLLSRVN